jgi:branched-chain amino acid transport system permease protein
VRAQASFRTGYRNDEALFPTWTSKIAFVALLVGLLVVPHVLAVKWLQGSVFALIAIIGALGLNLLTGMTGQVSLGHAFFFGLGCFTAAVLGGSGSVGLSTQKLVGYNLPWVVWLPAAGLVAGLAGLLVGPTAVRLKGLYLGIVTIGLVFLGGHIFDNATKLTGGTNGRDIPQISFFGHSARKTVQFAGIHFNKDVQWFYFCAIWVVLGGLYLKNLARTRTGRAFFAVRDRDIAASVMGVDVTRYKLTAFVISSVYAGVAGALYGAYIGRVVGSETFSLLFSIQFVAIIIIGGVGTVMGSVLGAAAVTLLPTVIDQFKGVFPFVSEKAGEGLIGRNQFTAILYGLVLIAFLVFEPYGLAGLWLRVKAYFKTWPFKY